MSAQPFWNPPQPMNSTLDYWEKHYPLVMYNSLTRSKNRFIPMDEKNKRVLWYMCGPTVYDQTHLGHGRTYICFDYIRRILENYFGYQVELVMNITDIDDKIIIRAAEQGWKEAHPNEKLPESKDECTKLVLSWASSQSAESNMERTKQLSSHWEKEFLKDMKSLDIIRPTAITRVSEYIPEIVEYIEQIIENGYAYESNGSVYFNTVHFADSKGKAYGKLVPENVGQAELLAEGEGSLSSSTNVGQSDKKNTSDFVLWKKSKTGEPFWESPWGQGRPGWHIECSVMASDTLKHVENGKIDIHTGGIDLRFPHHDNEIAQCEAYFDFDQWVNYFIHTGHLHIEGLKMSKSLKNFVKISEALMDNNSRQIRFLFLLHKYNVPMDYNDNTMNEAVAVEKFFSEFFLNIKAKLREVPLESTQKWQQEEKALFSYLLEIKASVHVALCDDLNTPLALSLLQDLAKEVNRYLASKVPVSMILTSAATYMTSILDIFGLVESSNDIGFPLPNSVHGENREQILTPYLNLFTHFRDQVRSAARNNDISALLTLCDTVRDDDLPALGVRLEDRTDAGGIWKLGSVEQFMEERLKKQQEKEAKQLAKQQALQAKQEKERLIAIQAEIVPADMFRSNATFSAFDDEGLPTHDAKGEPIPKSQWKKFKKEQDKQRKLYTKYHS